MMENELDQFLAHLDELSSDSISLDHQLLKEKEKNQRMNKLLVSLQSSTKDILSLYKNERLITIELQDKLNQRELAINSLERQYDELKKSFDNDNLIHKQLMEEVKQNHASEREDYINLCKDYFEMLSDTTCFYNYEIKKSQNKIISSSEKFLLNLDITWNKPKLIRSKRNLDNECFEVGSTVSRTSSRKSKRSGIKSKVNSEIKRRKTDIWDMKSISQAPSPAVLSDYDELSDLSSELCGAESSFSFNTFSIGNETSFSSLQSPTNPARDVKCKCHLFTDNDAILVSVGTNTDPPDKPLPSVPSLLIGDDDEGERNVHKRLHNLLTFFYSPVSKEVLTSFGSHQDSLQDSIHQVSSTSNTEGEIGKPLRNSNYFHGNKSVLAHSDGPKVPETAAKAEVESVPSVKVKQTVDQGTSPEANDTCNKSTSTVHSTTTRGTSTINVVKRNFGVQFPELSLESIFSETIFDLPAFLSPIHDIEDAADDGEMKSDELPPKEMKSTETMTELCNVNREISYLINSPILKAEKALIDPRDGDNNSFIILGQTLFDLFMKRIQKSNQLLSDDDITRQKIWKHLKRQLVDRFSELSFDETLNGSFSESDLIDQIPVEVGNSSNKEGHEERELTFDEIEVDSYSEAILKPGGPIEENLKPIGTIENVEKLTNESLSVSNNEELVELEEEVEEILQVETIEFTKESMISSDYEESEVTSDEFEEIFKNFKLVCLTPPQFIEPIDDLSDVIWGSLFPKDDLEAQESDDCLTELNEVLDGFDVDHEPIEIPTEMNRDHEVEEILKFHEPEVIDFDTPKSPLPFMLESDISPEEVIDIPTESSTNRLRQSTHIFDSALRFIPKVKSRIIHWQEMNKVKNNQADRQLCKARESIKSYLESEWTDKNLENCCKSVGSIDCLLVIREAIHETVQDNKHLKEISVEFTPPAPPLPPYQQKLIVLIQKLSLIHPQLPRMLIEDLEEKLFRLDNSSIDHDDLRNIGYYYTSLADVFAQGDQKTVLYFLVKCIYFYGYRSVPIIFVLLKAYPQIIPRKLELLKKNCKDIDWENMTGIELSKVFFDFECMDSLDLTIVFMITNFVEEEKTHMGIVSKMIKSNRKPENALNVSEHELFKFFSRFHGYFNKCIIRQRILQILMKRLDEGNLTNLSLSFILLSKRSLREYSLGTIVEKNLMPKLNNYYEEIMKSEDNAPEDLIAKLCLVIETISAVMKVYGKEKEKTIRAIFTKFVSIQSHLKNHKVQVSCIQAILRLQRFSDHHKEIYEIIKSHEDLNGNMNESLRYAIKTFIHRKCERFIKKGN